MVFYALNLKDGATKANKELKNQSRLGDFTELDVSTIFW